MRRATTNSKRQEDNHFTRAFNNQGSKKEKSEWRHYELQKSVFLLTFNPSRDEIE